MNLRGHPRSAEPCTGGPADRRAANWQDLLLGYSGLFRMLLHAGELSLLGALAGEIGAGSGGVLSGLVTGALVECLIGALVYRVRELGRPLDLSAGLVAGLWAD